jgi:hypothetical protein
MIFRTEILPLKLDTFFIEGEEKTTEESNSKWTQCQYCKLVITSVNLWRHVRTQHTSQPPRKCDFCKKTFKNKYSLREHVRISHENKQSTSKSDADGEAETPQPQTTQQVTSVANTAATTTTTKTESSTANVIYLEKL